MTSSNQRPKRNLKSTLVEPFRQIKFGLYIITISVAFVIASGLLFVMAFNEQYQHVMGIFNIVDPNLKWELVTNEVFFTNAVRLGVLLVGYITIMFSIVFWLTHRYYGPLVSIERFVESIGAGHYQKRVFIRKKDELQRLVTKLNAMAEILETRHGADVADGLSIPDTDDLVEQQREAS